jgi:hypothetical protein
MHPIQFPSSWLFTIFSEFLFEEKKTKELPSKNLSKLQT